MHHTLILPPVFAMLKGSLLKGSPPLSSSPPWQAVWLAHLRGFPLTCLITRPRASLRGFCSNRNGCSCSSASQLPDVDECWSAVLAAWLRLLLWLHLLSGGMSLTQEARIPHLQCRHPLVMLQFHQGCFRACL